jgi:hypothetical protein
MSLTLTLYATSWDDLAVAIGCQDRKLFRTVLNEMDPVFTEDYDEEDFDEGPDFEVGLERWIMGEVEVEQQKPPFQIVHLGEALAFVGLVRHFGRLAGSLTHSSAAGTLFRDKFLAEIAPQFLKAPYPLAHLLSRPVLDYESTDFPFWGGLRAPELAAIAPRLAQDAPIWPENPEIDTWFNELWCVLGSCIDLGREVISIYS